MGASKVIALKYTDEEIDKILTANPPVYASGKYYAEMSHKLKIPMQSVKIKCVKLGLINVRGNKRI